MVQARRSSRTRKRETPRRLRIRRFEGEEEGAGGGQEEPREAAPCEGMGEEEDPQPDREAVSAAPEEEETRTLAGGPPAACQGPAEARGHDERAQPPGADSGRDASRDGANAGALARALAEMQDAFPKYGREALEVCEDDALVGHELGGVPEQTGLSKKEAAARIDAAMPYR